MTEQLTITPIEAINEFYRLKDKYQSSYYEKYVKPIVKSNKSKREKRVEYSKLPKHECINCKRNVGTIFSIRNKIKDQIKYFTAKCGDIQDPCPLDIKINYSIREQFDTLIDIGLKNIEKIKLDIIKEKNNALFFDKDVVKQFEKLTDELKLESDNTGFLIESNILKNDNPEKRDLLKLTKDEFGKGFIIPFKQMIKEYLETNNELVLNQAVNFYINEMIPKLKEIQNLSYDVNYIEFDPETNIYNLIQIPNSLENKEFYWKNDDKLEKFVRGVRKDKKKTRKEDISENKKNKTRKIKPISELVLEEDIDNEGTDVTEEQSLLDSKFGEQIDVKPIISEDGSVTWNNKEYDDLWKNIPQKLKELLVMEPEWLQDYVDQCIKSRKNKQPCKMILPRQTKVPPTILENGKYDFGSKPINNIFNNFSKSYQDTLLTLYTTKDGVKNYDTLRNALEDIIEKTIIGFDYSKGYF